MLKTHRNALFQAVQASGLNPADFNAEVENDAIHGRHFRITHVPSGLWFLLRVDGPHYFTITQQIYTGDEPVTSGVARNVGIDAAVGFLLEWLEKQVGLALEDELLPDLWSEIQRFPAITVADEFSDEERTQVRLALETFRLLIAEEFHPSQEQMRVVEEKIDYLSEAVGRLSRFDWRGVAIAVLLNITVALNLDTEKGRQLYALFQKAFTALQYLLR